MKFLIPFLIGVVCTGVADMFWTLYTKAVGNGIPISAATWSSCIALIGVIDLYVFISYPLANGIGSVLGAFLGTYFTLKLLPHED